MSFLRSIRGKKAESLDDEALVKAYQEGGDLQALADVYERYMDLVYGLCLRYLEDPELARDAVMGVFEVIVRDLTKYPVEYFKSWLYRVTKNYCLMQLRSTGKGKIVEFGPELVYLEEELHLNEEVYGKLEKCMEALPEEQRRTITLFYEENKSYQEIGALTGQEWSKVRSQIQNGRRNLKICMERRTHVQKGV
ncbi:MAG TPA: sigma-70 family RNA polymerase sigma factor [Dinghuibacter sp.]|jgi:RNA polymerase sigma-70 factor (ECF subfamily)|uniref:RNA polymerase sigma factor n=1 Tax=Dinghuibacter sp. TaxID=2024697 RepID=UPI002C8D9053|nr:sigma-70 family RNA polymerase sigma factor [Dinghuibacter sp.]HTJ11177.1 sigma-70 family RNA polymerase sigma factor [Dinghuibacter sp.]